MQLFTQFLSHAADIFPGGVVGLAVLGALIVFVLFGAVMHFRQRHGSSRAEMSRRGNEVREFVGARRDGLTGLQTRQAFMETLGRRLASPGRVAVILIDVDRFGALNAERGHETGDEILRVLGERLRLLGTERDMAGRLGDDEFGLVVELTSGSGAEEGAALAVQRALCRKVPVAGEMLDVGVGMGVAVAPEHGRDADRLVRNASMALSRVKHEGGGWRVFDPAQEDALRDRTLLGEELHRAVQNGEFVPFYQPIVELSTGEIVGLEVLARWQHPKRGLLKPDLFIHAAEEMHLAGAISQCLLRRVTRDARDWPSWFYFAFNASPSQLRELVELVHSSQEGAESFLDPRRIEVEITESALIDDLDVAREVIASLQARGTRVVLDDFGTGYSNFFHLRELPFDRIKIDRGFVTGMPRHRRSEACVRAMVGLARTLSIDTVAEGVETVETASMLAALGCRFGQGFLYSTPVPALGVPALLRSSEALAVHPRAIEAVA